MTSPTSRTEAELAELDVHALLRAGLADEDGSPRNELFGEGAVAAAVQLDRHEVAPRSVGFLAEIARSGGARYVAGLSEPLPTPEQTDVIRPWLTAAADAADAVSGTAGDELVARWLDAVDALLAVRHSTRA